MKKNNKLFSFIVLLMSAFVYAFSTCSAHAADPLPAAVELKQSEATKQIQNRTIPPKTAINKRIVSKKKPVLKNEIPVIFQLMDWPTRQSSSNENEFILRFMLKWKDGNGDICDGKWFISYDHGALSGDIRDMTSTTCRPKLLPGSGTPVTSGELREDYIVLKGKLLDKVTISFVIQDAAGNFSNKVTRKVMLYP